MDQSAAAIVVDDLRKRYGKIEALRGVSLSIPRGEIFGLLGANGAGKTTLIKSLIGSLRPNGGSARVLGLDPLTQKAALRRQIGYMPQTPVLYDDLSARDNIRFFGRAHRMPHLEQEISTVLDFTGLREREHSPVHQFSGGMKQRLSLACTLVHQPRVLLLDEPTTGVDPKLREAFWAYFHKLAGEGVTLVISTHQMDEALFCDRLAVMRDGLILACDTPRDLLRCGRTTVRVTHGGAVESETLSNGPEALPAFLRRYHLDESVSRIEIEEDTLETVVLALINARQEDNHALHPQ